MIVKRLFWGAAIPLSIMVMTMACMGCNPDQNTTDAGLNQADKLTDSMDFKSGEKKSGQKPMDHASDNAYPQVTNFTFPSNLYPGPFKVNISFAYEGDAADVTGVSLHVTDSSRFWLVPCTVNSKKFDISIDGTFLAGQADILDKNFMIEVAVLRKDGLAGNYMPRPATPRNGSNPMPSYQDVQDSIKLPNGNTYEVVDNKNLPPESLSEAPKVVTFSSSKDAIAPDEEFDLVIGYAGPRPIFLLFQVDGAEKYLQIALRDEQVTAQTVTVPMSFNIPQATSSGALVAEDLKSLGSVGRPLDLSLVLKASLMSSAGKRGNMAQTQLNLSDRQSQDGGFSDGSTDGGGL